MRNHLYEKNRVIKGYLRKWQNDNGIYSHSFVFEESEKQRTALRLQLSFPLLPLSPRPSGLGRLPKPPRHRELAAVDFFSDGSMTRFSVFRRLTRTLNRKATAIRFLAVSRARTDRSSRPKERQSSGGRMLNLRCVSFLFPLLTHSLTHSHGN